MKSSGKPPSERIAKAPSAAELGSRPARVTLLPIEGAVADGPVLGLDPRRPAQRTYLVLKGLHTWAQPEVLYHVYVSPTAGGRLDQDSHVGYINFFDAEFHDHGHGAMGTALGQNLYSFDVTEVLKQIARSGNPNGRQALFVTFVPGGTPTPGGKPLVGTVELVRE